MEDAAVRGEALRLTLGGRELLRSVDISIRRAEVFGVMGANGAGKTSLLRILAGDLAPMSGKVWLEGTDVTRMPLWERARRGLGYVPQAPSVLLDLSVSDNIHTFEIAARAKPRSPKAWAEQVALESHLDVRAGSLSGGERRRLELLRAMIADPKVLLCDEPFAAGDPAHIRLLAGKLRQVADAGTAVVIADHRISDALPICDRAMLLADGAVGALVEASGFLDHPAVRDRYLGEKAPSGPTDSISMGGPGVRLGR